MAFFPCVYFEEMQMTYYIGNCVNLKHMNLKDRFDAILDRINKREHFYTILYKLFFVSEMRGLRIIVENPATQPHYLLFTQNFYRKPTIIDNNRQLRGDYFKKPTAYWFFNCEPTYGISYQKPKETKIIMNCKRGKGQSICSEERSMISPDYARNFICDFIIGKVQKHTQLDLFEI